MGLVNVIFYNNTGQTLWLRVIKGTDILDVDDDTFKAAPSWANSLSAATEDTTVSMGHYAANITFPSGIHVCYILILDDDTEDAVPIDGFKFIADGTNGQEITLGATVGTDGKILISVNAQDLSTSLDVNAKLVNSTTPASVTNLVDGLLAITGITEGGTMTWQTVMKIMAAFVAGNWRVKAGDTTKQELMDAEDGTTIILEQSLTRSPTAGNKYRDITVKI